VCFRNLPRRGNRMRYMGDVATDLLTRVAGGPLDPAVKAQLLVTMASLPDESARDVADLSDATPFGGRQRMTRLAMGAAVGLVVGFVVGRALKKR
jgi:hypothetical protein